MNDFDDDDPFKDISDSELFGSLGIYNNVTLSEPSKQQSNDSTSTIAVQHSTQSNTVTPQDKNSKNDVSF